MNSLDKQYQALLQDILDNGVQKVDRTGTGTISVFGRQIRHKMSEGFPLLTTKKMAWKSMVTELVWFLNGDTDIRFLWENNCNIWDGDWYKHYKNTCSKPYTIEEVKQKVKEDKHFFHDSMFNLGPIYGKQWRRWKGKEYSYSAYETPDNIEIDQIEELIEGLRSNPDSRRLMVSSWNVGELEDMVLPPCHYGFQVYTRELSHDERFEIYKNSNIGDRVLQDHITGINFKQFHFDEANIPKRAISLMWNQRSVDTFLGLPFNIASYGLLLEMIADEVNMVPDELIGNLGDVHLYSNHIDAAKIQIDREPFELPIVYVRDGIFSFMPGDVILENYKSHPAIKAPLSN